MLYHLMDRASSTTNLKALIWKGQREFCFIFVPFGQAVDGKVIRDVIFLMLYLSMSVLLSTKVDLD